MKPSESPLPSPKVVMLPDDMVKGIGSSLDKAAEEGKKALESGKKAVEDIKGLLGGKK